MKSTYSITPQYRNSILRHITHPAKSASNDFGQAQVIKHTTHFHQTVKLKDTGQLIR